MLDIQNVVGEALRTSDFLSEIRKVNEQSGRSILFGDGVRPLTDAEIKTLESQRNACPDWKRVLVVSDFSPRMIYNCYFAGDCVLGHFSKMDNALGDGVIIPAGLFDAVILNCEIGHNATLHQVGQISNYVVQSDAIVANVRHLAANPGTNFGVGRVLPLANEVGGREVAVYPEITIGVADAIARNRNDKRLQEAYTGLTNTYTQRAQSKKGIVCSGAKVLNTPKIVDTFVGPGAIIDGASAVIRSVLLSLPDEKSKVLHGAYVCDSVLQWGSDADTMALVDRSVLCEHSHAERHGKATDSIVGPNSGVAEGELTASLLGPFVGFHHQSLLIAAYWPEGKGNVGYGANVGSNHTAKAPDQEIWCGEGTFFGLSVNIKFPCNFSRAPYSILATGVTCLPQTFEFPFSLINTPAEQISGASPSYNEVFPGWVLSDNLYMVMRNEGKYKKRNKAKREQFVFDVFRPDVVDLMIDARRRLDVKPDQKKDYYIGDKVIKGLGKNYLSDKNRLAGLETYTFYIRYYALKGLLRVVSELVAGGKTSEVGRVLGASTSDAQWEHERRILSAEFPNHKKIGDLLSRLADMQTQIASDVENSKQKDDERGARIIPDYADSHTPAAQDSFVRETRESTAALKRKISELIALIQ